LNRFRQIFPSNILIEQPENMGHCPHVEQPKWFCDRVIQFIQSAQ
jgi:hypothetical protein